MFCILQLETKTEQLPCRDWQNNFSTTSCYLRWLLQFSMVLLEAATAPPPSSPKMKLPKSASRWSFFSACFARSFCGWKMMEPKTIASWLSASFCPNNKRGYQLSDFSKTTYHLSAFVILNRKCNTNHNTPSISKIKFSTSQKWYSCNWSNLVPSGNLTWLEYPHVLYEIHLQRVGFPLLF